MTSVENKAKTFASLHIKGEPIVLYNIWDVAGAKALKESGANAVATGSASMAGAHGFDDGEAIPLSLVLQLVSRITSSVEIPVSVDFEGGYSSSPAKIEENVAQLLDTGVVGLNFEDQVVSGPGLNAINDQCDRISAIRRAADAQGVPLFINARTDVFLKADPDAAHASLMDEANERERAYAAAGADGFFVPGLADPNLIRSLCERSSLPINVMVLGDFSSVSEIAKLGVSRISYGPAPYSLAIADLTSRYRAAMNS